MERTGTAVGPRSLGEGYETKKSTGIHSHHCPPAPVLLTGELATLSRNLCEVFDVWIPL
jgi:hypothetical protein